MIVTITLNAAIDKRYVTSGAKMGEVNRVLACEYTPGGKGLNVSKVLKISGAEVLASGILGGYAGQYIEARLNEMEIPSGFYYVSGESRSCINIWDDEKKQQTEYLEPGVTVTENEVEGFLKLYKEQIIPAQVISISGSVPNGVPKDIYKKMVEAALQQGKKVILDTSGELLEYGLAAKPTLIKPNIDEIRLLTGKECQDMGELVDAGIALHKQGIEKVVISLGGSGAILVSKEGIYQTIVPKIEAVNTVGCGDAMVAGLAIGLSKEYTSAKLIKTASSIATAAAMSEYTGHYDPEVSAKIYQSIEIKKIG